MDGGVLERSLQRMWSLGRVINTRVMGALDGWSRNILESGTAYRF